MGLISRVSSRTYRGIILAQLVSKMDDDLTPANDNTAEYATYEDFLDSQISAYDLYYLEDEELARQLVELGYRGSGEVLKREEFLARKKAAEASRVQKRNQQRRLAFQNQDTGETHEFTKHDAFLSALAEREEANRTGRMTSIVFIRDRNSRGQEISGYIDYASRLKHEDFSIYFSGKKRLLPKSTDLSFYNWETQTSTSKPTGNYQVIADSTSGLLFKNKRDRKIMNVDPKASSPGDNSSRIAIEAKQYIQALIYDHLTRRKT